MRLTKSKRGAWLVLAVLGAIGIARPAHAAPVGTSITYQGQLKNAGGPAGGLHDLRFRLYDAVTFGAPVGAVVCIDNVNVIAGLFTVSLDFGAQFAGQERFLEIEVRADTGLNCANPAGFAALTPRQAITAAPHALFALNASSAINATNATTATNALTATSATTATNATQLGGQSAAFYQNASNQSAGTLNNLRLPVPLSLTGNSGTAVIFGENTSTGNFSSGVLGQSLAATGTARGVTGQCSSTDGTGVFGVTTATSGTAAGVSGLSASTGGRGVIGSATAGTGAAYGVLGLSTSTAGIGVVGQSTATSGFANGGYFESSSTQGRGVFAQALATSGVSYGGRFGSASTSGTGVSGIASATSGVSFGVHGETFSTEGRAVVGSSNAATGTNFGGAFGSASTSGTGVWGDATAASGVTNGVWGRNASTSGRGVYGATTAGSGTGVGVFGQAFATSGFSNGGYFESASTEGRGVFAQALASTGPTHGGRFGSASTSGVGVSGVASAASGITFGVHGRSDSQDGRGVYGVATSNVAGGSRYGVLGEAIPFAPPPFYRYGVYAIADLGASGYKTFRIDHPDDPENLYLIHYSTESPEAINFYRGTASLDGAGAAVVELPHYFAKINKTPSYMLTAVGAPMPMLHVAREIDEAALSAGARAEPGEAAPVCSFRIAGGAPGGKVSWRVEALRNDKWAQRSGAPVEIEKQGVEKGTYQHPDLYNQPPEKGMNYDAQSESSQSAPNEPVAAAQMP